MDIASEFSKLPPEVQQRIINRNPNLVRLFAQTSRYYRDLLTSDIREICSRKISQNEISTYLNSFPAIFGFTDSVIDDDNVLSFYFYIHIKAADNYFVNSFTCTLTNNFDLLNIYFNNNIENNNNIIQEIFDNTFLPIYDYITYYRIFKNRLICMRINPSFAKQITIDLIKSNMVSRYNDEYYNKNFHTTAYINILMNSPIFNIYPPPDYDLLNDINLNLDLIKSEINRITPLLIQHINTLP